ncbi:class I SAM-dependent methyltransferase [bacterium]|nr:class I SAM-dependent methyltransferase [bacterium]
MRIKFIQKLIDRIRYGNLSYSIELNSFQKEVIEKIKEYQGKIKYQESKNKEKMFGYESAYSTQDPLGMVLKKEGEIYRTVFEKSREHFIELYETGILQAFSDFGIIPKFELTNYFIDNNPIIFKVEKLKIVPPQYWTMGMIKDEAKLTLEINEILNVFGYKLIDGHPFNVAFKNSKPVFFDFGSFVKMDNKEDLSESLSYGIYQYNIIPLIMHQLNTYWSKRHILSIENGITCIPCVDYSDSFEVKSAVKRFRNIKNSSILKRITRKKKKYIKSSDIDALFNSNSKVNSYWGKYYGNNQEGFIEERYQKVLDCINKHAKNPRSLLDLAGNAGHFAALARKNTNIKDIVSVDYDENAIELGRKIHKEDDIDFYLLYFMQHHLINVDKIAKPFKADVVSALAVTHHLLLTQKYGIDYMLQTFKKYSNKYVFIEFCPLGLFSHYLKELPKIPDWYTTEWFEENFKKYFKLLEKKVTARAEFKGKEYDHRVLFAGEIL